MHRHGFPASGLPAHPNVMIASTQQLFFSIGYEWPLPCIKSKGNPKYMSVMVLVPKTLKCKQTLLILLLNHEAQLNIRILIFCDTDSNCWK